MYDQSVLNIMQDKKNKVKNIFDSIAFRYDFLNHLLSFGVDKYWRRKALKLSKVGSESFCLMLPVYW
ncbi:MAG: class I SAM-dependent methyltransferase [Ignavibacteriaceae bacterium]|nr:class I SAM-dependent methyltransferase [Ignavibacteriaceae bacterium]